MKVKLNHKYIVLFFLFFSGITIQVRAEVTLPTDQVFLPTSFWYTTIPKDVVLHPNSSKFVTEFLMQKSAYYGNVTINTTSYASPVYYPTAGASTIKVTEWNCQNKKAPIRT